MPATVRVPEVGCTRVATDADEGGLAGAVGPEDGEDLAPLGVEVEPVEGVDLAEVLGEADGLDDWIHGPSLFPTVTAASQLFG